MLPQAMNYKLWNCYESPHKLFAEEEQAYISLVAQYDTYTFGMGEEVINYPQSTRENLSSLNQEQAS